MKTLFAAVPDRSTIVLAPETKTYQRRDDAITVRQFVVADPDGYLLRFSEVTATTMQPSSDLSPR